MRQRSRGSLARAKRHLLATSRDSHALDFWIGKGTACELLTTCSPLPVSSLSKRLRCGVGAGRFPCLVHCFGSSRRVRVQRWPRFSSRIACEGSLSIGRPETFEGAAP